MRILFYLPVMTPWWFDNIVLPLIRTLATEAEVHVLAPMPWRNTGIHPNWPSVGAAPASVRWHIVHDESHPTLRMSPEKPQALIDFARSLDADYTLCRSADAVTPSAFPGKVRYMMESSAPPLPGIPRNFMLQEDLLHQGHMPALSAAERERIDQTFEEPWSRFQVWFDTHPPFDMTRDQALAHMGLDTGRKVVALALEYANEENFFHIHHGFPDTLELIDRLSRQLDDDIVLAVTDHPLNYRYADNSVVYAAIEALGPRARLIENDDSSGKATNLLVKHCDGMIVQNSKTIFSAAYFGKPILRLSSRRSASWLNASQEIDPFFGQLRSGTAPAPSAADARTWFGLQMMHEVINPPTLSLGELVDRVERPFDEERLEAGLKRFETTARAHIQRLSGPSE